MINIGQILMYMSRLAGAVLIALLAGSCASRPDRPPSDQANLCAIFDERPEWQEAVTASARRWGAPVPVQMAILWKESGFRANAKPPKKHILGFIPWGRRSSAYGYPQAIDGTWDWYRDETGNRGADRDDFDDAADFVGWYMSRTSRVNGVPMHDAYSHYIAYHQGHAGYRSGRWKQVAWLKRVAGEVNSRSHVYSRQLSRCS